MTSLVAQGRSANRGDSASRSGTGLVVIAAAVTVASILIETGPENPSGELLAPQPSWMLALIGTVIAVVAGVSGSRPDRNHSGRLVRLLRLCSALWLIAAGLHLMVRHPWWSAGFAEPINPAETAVVWLLALVTVPLAGWAWLVVALFPTGRFLPGRWGALTRSGMALVLGSGLLLATSGLPVRLAMDPGDSVVTPVQIPMIGPTLGAHPRVLLAVGYVGSVLVASSVLARYHRSGPGERNQLRWLLWAVVVVSAITAVSWLLLDFVHIGTLGTALAAMALTVSVGIALVAPDLLVIGELLARTITAVVVAAVVLAASLGAIGVISDLVGDRLDRSSIVLGVLLLASLVHASLWVPIGAAVDRIVLGERDDPYDAISGLARRLEQAVSEPDQLGVVVVGVAEAFGSDYVRVEVDHGQGTVATATVGPRPGQVQTLPITYRAQQVGRLTVSGDDFRSDAKQQDPESQRLLADLVRQVATVTRASVLAEQLQQNRERLVTAREEERRRIHRSLHENLAPRLAGLVHQVSAAQMEVTSRPDRADQRLAAAGIHLQELVGEVRAAVRDLRPPALDDLGLIGALRQATAQVATEGDQVEFSAAELGRMPAAVEVAAYRIVHAALTTLAQRPGGCRFDVRRDHRDLVIAVDYRGEMLGEEVAGEPAVEIGGSRSDEVTGPDARRLIVRLPAPAETGRDADDPT